MLPAPVCLFTSNLDWSFCIQSSKGLLNCQICLEIQQLFYLDLRWRFISSAFERNLHIPTNQPPPPKDRKKIHSKWVNVFSFLISRQVSVFQILTTTNIWNSLRLWQLTFVAYYSCDFKFFFSVYPTLILMARRKMVFWEEKGEKSRGCYFSFPDKSVLLIGVDLDRNDSWIVGF